MFDFILFDLFYSMVVLVSAEFYYCSWIHWMAKMAPLNNDDDNNSTFPRWYEQTLTTNLTYLAHCRLCCYNSNYVCTVCALTLTMRSHWLINKAMLCVEHNFIYLLYIIIYTSPASAIHAIQTNTYRSLFSFFFQFNLRQTCFEFVLSGFSSLKHTHTHT